MVHVFVFSLYGASPLRKLQTDPKCRRIAISCGCRSEHQLIPATPKDAIILVSRIALAFRGIGLIGMDAIRQFVVEVHLRRELQVPLGSVRGANLHVNVHGPARIPTGIDGEELGFATRVGDLVAAQKLLADGVETKIPHIRIDAQRIAVPDIHLGAGQWLTISGAKSEYLQCQREWRSGFDLPV